MAIMKLRKIGNSLGAILSKEILNKAGFAEGEELEIIASRGEVTLRKANGSKLVEFNDAELTALAAGEFESKAGKSALGKVRKAAK